MTYWGSRYGNPSYEYQYPFLSLGRKIEQTFSFYASTPGTTHIIFKYEVKKSNKVEELKVCDITVFIKAANGFL